LANRKAGSSRAASSRQSVKKLRRLSILYLSRRQIVNYVFICHLLWYYKHCGQSSGQVTAASPMLKNKKATSTVEMTFQPRLLYLSAISDHADAPNFSSFRLIHQRTFSS
jgi:hypothetical protein